MEKTSYDSTIELQKVGCLTCFFCCFDIYVGNSTVSTVNLNIRRLDASCSTITSNRRSIGWKYGKFLQLFAEDTKISLNKKGFQTGNKYIYLIYNVIESYCNLNMKIIRTRNILIGGKIDIHF